MHASRRDAILAVSSLLIGVMLTHVLSALFGGRWQASGDGETIYNTRTGELRYTASGLSVQAVRQAQAKTAELEAEERKKRELEEMAAKPIREKNELEVRKKDLIAKVEWVRQSFAANGVSGLDHRSLFAMWFEAMDLNSRGLVSDEILSEVNIWVKSRENRDKELFKQLKAFTAKHSFDEPGDTYFRMSKWEPATRPFRIKDSLTAIEKQKLLDVFGEAVSIVDELKRQEFEQAIGVLREYQAYE